MPDKSDEITGPTYRAEPLAGLAIGARLQEPTDIIVVECVKQNDHWAVVAESDGKTYRVRVPLNDLSEVTISVDVD